MFVVGEETHVCLLSVQWKNVEHEMTRNKRPILKTEIPFFFISSIFWRISIRFKGLTKLYLEFEF